MSHQTLHLASVRCYNSLLFGEISWADLSKCLALSVAAQHSCHLVLAANRWSSDSISIYADNAGTSCTVWEAHTVYRWLHLLLSYISHNKTPKVAALLSTLWTKSTQNDACHDTKIAIAIKFMSSGAVKYLHYARCSVYYQGTYFALYVWVQLKSLHAGARLKTNKEQPWPSRHLINKTTWIDDGFYHLGSGKLLCL